jgi:hypothetical protein
MFSFFKIREQEGRIGSDPKTDVGEEERWGK